MAKTDEMNVAELLVAEMKESEAFTRENFGLKLGSDYPEIAREILANKKICAGLMAGYAIAMMNGDGVAKRLTALPSASDTTAIVSQIPEIYEGQLSFLYWGIQIGRELERRQAGALKAMETQNG